MDSKETEPRNPTADLALLMKRLSETPEIFLVPGNPAALVHDLFLDRGFPPPGAEEKGLLLLSTVPEKARTCQLIQIHAWLASGSELPAGPDFPMQFLGWVTSPYLENLAGLMDPRQFITDPERREELVRHLLHALNLQLQGESPQQGADRLATLDSLERKRILDDTKAAALRAQKLREEMARKEAEEAASKYNRE